METLAFRWQKEEEEELQTDYPHKNIPLPGHIVDELTLWVQLQDFALIPISCSSAQFELYKLGNKPTRYILHLPLFMILFLP